MTTACQGQRHGHTAFGRGQNAALPAGKMHHLGAAAGHSWRANTSHFSRVPKIQNRSLVPLYAGAARTPGLEQINVAVPADLQGVTSNLTICAMGTGSQQYCSQPESIALKP